MKPILHVWNVNDRSHRWELRNTSKIYAVAVAMDGALAAVGSDDGAIRLWNVARRQAYTVAFSPDGTRLATGGDDLAVKLWDVESAVARQPATEPSACRTA